MRSRFDPLRTSRGAYEERRAVRLRWEGGAAWVGEPRRSCGTPWTSGGSRLRSSRWSFCWRSSAGWFHSFARSRISRSWSSSPCRSPVGGPYVSDRFPGGETRALHRRRPCRPPRARPGSFMRERLRRGPYARDRGGTCGTGRDDRPTSDERAAFRERVFRGDRGGRSRRGTRDGTPTLPPRFPSRPRAAGRPPSPARGVRGALALAGRPAVEVGHGANNVRRCDRRGAGTDRRPGSPLLRRWPPGPAHRGRRRDPSSRRGNRRTGWSRRHRGTGPRRSQRLEETTSGLPTLGSSEVASPPSTRPFVSREADVRDRRSGGTKASLRRDQGLPAPRCERPLPPRRPRLRGGTGASHRPGPPPSSPPPGRADHRPRGAGPRPGRA